MRNRAFLAAAVAAWATHGILTGTTSAAGPVPVGIARPSTTQPATFTAAARRALIRDADALARTVGTLPADEAARRWLDLSDRQRSSLNTESRWSSSEYAPPVGFDAVLPALPTAKQLPALKAALDARPLNDAGGQRVALLKMLVATLRGGPKDLDAAFDDLRAAAVARDTPKERIDKRLDEFRTTLAGGAAPAAQAEDVTRFEQELDEAQRPGESVRTWPMQVPDLVTAVGDAKAKELIDRALKRGRLLEVSTGDATRKLARERALATIDDATTPQWKLCQAVEATDLYEATARKFPPPTTAKATARGKGPRLPILIAPNDDDESTSDAFADERNEARVYYVLGLIVRGRSDDALRVAAEMKESSGAPSAYEMKDATDALYRDGFAEPLYQFLKRAVMAEPDGPFWDTLVASAARSGHGDEVLKIARDAAARPNLDATARRAADRHLADALLAADQLDEGIPLLKRTLDAKADPAAAIHDEVRLATIGRLAGKDAVVDDALDAATKHLLALPDLGADNNDLEEWAREMRLAGRTDALAGTLRKQLDHLDDANNSSYRTATPLRLMAQAYFEADAPGDVVAMLDSLKQWGVADVADLPPGWGGHGTPTPAMLYAAWGLIRTGNRDAGLAALDVLLEDRAGLDAAYQLLVDSDPEGAAAKLDALAARDPFEERPLIWKGVLQQKAGRLDEAERTLREAIAVDPSDGDEGKGDRMRVYAVLADVLAAKGDAKQSEFLHGVVKAIRLSEDADDAWQAGLLRRAVKMYEEALTHFADAYCVQSRLAVQLADMGRESEAEEHYRRAYELMPDSFGRVESHCFGCEGAFRSPQAQGIAERVFVRLLAKDPKKPQLHYLLGYLRSSQGRHAEALPEFRQAVALDPKYLNAWKSLLECGDHVAIDPAERDRATAAVVALDPLGRHSSPSAEKVADLPAFYAAASGIAVARPARPATVYPLRAAAAALAAPHGSGHYSFTSSSDRGVSTAAKLVADHPRVKPIVKWMDEFGQ